MIQQLIPAKIYYNQLNFSYYLLLFLLKKIIIIIILMYYINFKKNIVKFKLYKY
jgi:hypothetical protein